MRCHLKRLVRYTLTLTVMTMFILTVFDIQGKLHSDSEDPLPIARIRPKIKVRKDPYLWPNGLNEKDDRITAQMSYIPKNLDLKSNDTRNFKTILLFFNNRNTLQGQKQFIKHRCPVNQCFLTSDRKLHSDADAVLFMNGVGFPHWNKPLYQIWILYLLEAPPHSAKLDYFRGLINWTATYRRDSTLVTPYERWTPNSPDSDTQPLPPPSRNYAFNKTRKVAWFVSNCHAKNGRDKYGKELQKYIDVDIYGSCGKFKCYRQKANKCFEKLKRDYKFYLSFENSNCKDYITEKLFWNAYKNNVIPIVLGARPQDYKLSTPPNSHIHVDDFDSPKQLAEYLHKLDNNDDLYNEYFRWKGTGEFIDTKFWCRLCAMLHDDSRNSWYDDINSWWRGGDTCSNHRDNATGYATWKEKKTPLSTRRKSIYVKEPLIYGTRNLSNATVHDPYNRKKERVKKEVEINKKEGIRNKDRLKKKDKIDNKLKEDIAKKGELFTEDDMNKEVGHNVEKKDETKS